MSRYRVAEPTVREKYTAVALKGIDAAKWRDGEPYVQMAKPFREEIANLTALEVTGFAWERAQEMYGDRQELDHDACGDGGCNACILDDIATILGVTIAGPRVKH